ncbi:MAG: ferrochelatase [Thermodesulfovibrionales bacterium]
MGVKGHIGIILLNLGGPDSIRAIRPFLFNLFSDREIIRLGPAFMQKPLALLISLLRSGKTERAYSLIGGGSPILDITKAQAKALENLLNPIYEIQASRFKVYVGMRYWYPFIEEAIEKAINDGVEGLIGLSLYPHYSIATTGSARKEFERVIKERKEKISYSFIDSWFDNPFYIEAMVDVIKKGFESFGRMPVLFSAHSLPERFILEGDPYLEEIKGTIKAISGKIEIEFYLSFQSKSGAVKWLEPSTEKMLHTLAEKGIKKILVVPISFVSDHVETLYEIDILYKGLADRLGIKLFRTESLNTHPMLIRALKDLVIRKVKELGWTR